MADEAVLNLPADSRISVRPEGGKEKYTLYVDGCQCRAGSRGV